MLSRNLVIPLLLATVAFPICAADGTDGASRVARTAGASSQMQPPAQEGQPQFSVEAALVNVNVLVTDEDGRVIPGLQRENFRVLDNGVPQPITHFSPSTAPITIVMLLEYSARAYDYYATKAVQWGAAFLDRLEPGDWVALVTYDLNSTVRVDFTHNRASVHESLASLSFPSFREANLFDAVIDTLDKLQPVRGRKSILLLSTGANTLGASTYDEVTKRLRGSDVTIFSVGLAEEEYMRSMTSDMGYIRARSWLQSFSDNTGGIAFFPRFPAEMHEIFDSVTGFLRSEYTLSFSPARESRDGRYHKLTVQVVRPDGSRLTVRDQKGRERKVSVIARPGYTAPRAAVPTAAGAD